MNINPTAIVVSPDLILPLDHSKKFQILFKDSAFSAIAIFENKFEDLCRMTILSLTLEACFVRSQIKLSGSPWISRRW